MGEYNSVNLDEVFVAVADSTRRAILTRLSNGEARVTDLAGDFPISLNSTSKHIKILERAGLVQRTVQGREHILSLNAAPLAEATAWMRHYEQFWNDRLASLEAFIATKGKRASKGSA